MKFIQQMFSDVDGQGSHKRLVTFGIFLLIAAIALGVTFWKANFNNNIWDDLIYTFLFCVGAITSEKFTKRGIRTEKDSATNA